MKTDEEIKKILKLKNIAVVGFSKNEENPSHYVPKYLISKGYNIIPVNPNVSELCGMKAYRRLSEVPDYIDIVEIFRPSEEVLEITKKAIEKNVKVIWMQQGIVNHKAAELAEKNSIEVVMDKCMMTEHKRLVG
ncbi:MAG: CoA-binding protein [Candidatus Methanofastidiosia archaeon]